MLQRNLKLSLLLALSIAALAQNISASVAQEPLLNRPNTVAPNLTLILDTSGSMGESYIYQYGNISSGYGRLGPGPNNNSEPGYRSPDVNKIYYDPRIRYLPRVNYLGVALAEDTPTSKDPGWKVYIRDTTSTPTTACPAGAYVAGKLVDLNCYYNPSYTPPSGLVVTGSIATYPNEVDKNTKNWTLFPKFTNRTDCVTPTAVSATACTLTEEGQNRSNWKKWYSTRGLMATTGIGHAFQPLKDDSIRLGYTTIGYINSNSKLNRGVSSYSPLAGGTKDLFFSWLYGSSFGNSTPNLVAVDRVGQYYERTDSDGPWATVPNPASNGISTVSTPTGPGKAEFPANHASCRRSFSMLVTDGYSNGGTPTRGNSDNTGFSIAPAVGAPFVYTPSFPYKDSYSNTMADIAMYYWGRDLRTLANRVPTISTSVTNNPSTWQNVSFYAVTLGIDGDLPQTASTLANITSGATPWPKPVMDQPSSVDDLWHATINARGELLNASNSSELTTGLNRMFETIAGTPQTLSGVAVSATFLKNGTRKYKPEYIPGTWSGKLSAIALDASTGNDANPINVHWQVESGVDATTKDPISLIPVVATRKNNVYTWSGSTAVVFNAANTGLNADLVAYLLGDPSKELRKPGGTYRNRTAILGDIVNSNPTFILNNIDIGYEKLMGSFGNYRSFIASKAARAEGVLFVGANDGMLHAFRDSTGVETFAFVPKAVVPKLDKLAETPYVHQYYVDGPNVETDAYLSSAWKNILLGSTGAGAKAVYSLDVTNPLAMDASKVMWEINSTTSGFSELGHVLSEVQAGILPNGDWVAIFGNGFDSAGGVARLFVVNLQTGALLKSISTDVGGSNGLGGVRVVRDATQRIIGAYAGDLKGNLWKFDLSGTSADWKVGLSGSALYAAGNTQSITATPAVIEHPNGGYMVTFGTGKFFDSADNTGPYTTQRLYGVWDAQPFAVSPPTGAPVTGLASLVQQTITTMPVTSGGITVDYFRVSTNTVTWGNGLTGVRGWYINLPNSGQRVVYPVERLAGTFVLASTLSPESSASADLCVQSGSGSGWAYIIDGVTGSGTTKPTLDTNGDGKVDDLDVVVSGWQDPVDGRPTPIGIESTKTKDTYCIVTAQNKCTKVDILCGQLGAKACPPVTFTGIKSRDWRQLFMR
jgi:type IV pilus assembly protein PilY1